MCVFFFCCFFFSFFCGLTKILMRCFLYSCQQTVKKKKTHTHALKKINAFDFNQNKVGYHFWVFHIFTKFVSFFCVCVAKKKWLLVAQQTAHPKNKFQQKVKVTCVCCLRAWFFFCFFFATKHLLTLTPFCRPMTLRCQQKNNTSQNIIH